MHISPETGDWFKPFFLASEQSGLRLTLEHGSILRIRTISMPTEAVGEYCAMLVPYACYRIADSRKSFYAPALIILMMGIALSGTRSGIILSFLGILTYYVLVEKNKQIKILHLSIIGAVILFLIAYSIGTSVIISRFFITYNEYYSGSDFGTIVNRKFLFEENWKFFLNSLSFFGNGMISPVAGGYLLIDFHNIYLTIIYQFGMIGSIFYFSLPFFLLKSLLKTLKKCGEQLKFTKVCTISFLIFLINEMKFEFTRKLDYVMIVWILLSIYYLHTKQFSVEETEKPVEYSK